MAKCRLTMDTLENIFLYLGCANIATSQAMDGAIPLEGIAPTAEGNEVIAANSTKGLEMLPTEWNMKCVWMGHGDSLKMATLQDTHWASVSLVREHSHRALSNNFPVKRHLTADATALWTFYYSEINRYGNFNKFKVPQYWSGGPTSRGVLVKKLYNPRWLLEVHGEYLVPRYSDNNQLWKDQSLGSLAHLMCGLRQSIDSYWLVKTRFDTVCPSLTLLTDPTGVKEFWKLRDIPEGKKRRAALLHWVNDHWRKNRADPDVETYVRKHMRGQQDLKQGQFEAHIEPSKKDKIEVELLKEQRKELKRVKADRRARRQLLRRTLNH